MTAIMNRARRALSALTLGTMLGGTALIALSCVNPLQDELEGAKNTIKDLEGQISDLNGQVAALGGQLTAKDGELAAKQAEISAKQAEITELTARAADLTQDIADLEAARADLTAQLGSANTAAEAEKAALQAGIAGLEDDIAALNGELEALETANTAAAAEKAALQAGIAGLEDELSSLNDELEALETANTASEEEIATLRADIAGLEDDIAALNGELEEMEAANAGYEEENAALQAEIAGLEDDIAALNGELEELGRANAGYEEEKAALQDDIADLDGQIDDKNTQLEAITQSLAEANQDIAELTAEKNDLIAERNLLTKQLDVALVGGQLHDAAWFTQHDANVAAAQTLGNELTTVFLGDGVVREIWDNASGVIDSATAIGKFSNLKTTRAFVIGAPGDNIGDIKARLGYRKDPVTGQIVRDQAAASEMPAKPAYIVSHFGQREVELSGLDTTYDGAKATKTGQYIGASYAWVQEEFPESSTISSGIIPIPSNPIGTGNTSDINGQIQSAIGDITGTTNRYVPTTISSTATNLTNGINVIINNMTENGM